MEHTLRCEICEVHPICEIVELLHRCNDADLLDFILRLLRKSL